MEGKPRHKKFFYRPFLYVSAKDFNGLDSIPSELPFEFFSESSCQDFVSHNALNVQWPEGYLLPQVTGACDPICFCAVYRRQVARYWLKRPWRAWRLIWAGYERRRRSGAEEAGIDLMTQRKLEGDIIKSVSKRGYHVQTIFFFIKSFLLWLVSPVNEPLVKLWRVLFKRKRDQ